MKINCSKLGIVVAQPKCWNLTELKRLISNDKAFQRVKEHVYFLENQRMKNTGYQRRIIGKWFILDREILPKRKRTLIFVNEGLGF